MSRCLSEIVFCALLFVTIGSLRGQSKVLVYDEKKAFAYAEKWCTEGNDCPNGQYNDPNNTDCTHFMAHILNAGSVKISGAGASCDSGLCVRVKEMAAWFSNASKDYQNVEQFDDWKKAKRGDLCFLKATVLGLSLGSKNHVMLLADKPTEAGAKVFAHQNNHCGEFTTFDVDKCVFYRIKKFWDGSWTSTDPEKRFHLIIQGDSVDWTELRAGGKTLTKKVTLKPEGTSGQFRISRINDEEVLLFLDFPDARLRAAILAQRPEASFIVLKSDGEKIQGQWHGLLVRKKPKGELDSIVQPSAMPAKIYAFVRD
jgi:hypothetical protein